MSIGNAAPPIRILCEDDAARSGLNANEFIHEATRCKTTTVA